MIVRLSAAQAPQAVTAKRQPLLCSGDDFRDGTIVSLRRLRPASKLSDVKSPV